MRSARLLIPVIVLASAVFVVQRFAFAATNFDVTNNDSMNYVIGGNSNPSLTLTRGQTYTFNVNTLGHPFWIVTARGAANVMANQVTTGVTNNGTGTGNGVGVVTFVVPSSAPATLFYQCGVHDNMGGTLNIVSQPVPSSGAIPLAVLGGLLLLAAVVVLRRRAT
jgi:hypothetical protein